MTFIPQPSTASAACNAGAESLASCEDSVLPWGLPSPAAASKALLGCGYVLCGQPWHAACSRPPKSGPHVDPPGPRSVPCLLLPPPNHWMSPASRGVDASRHRGRSVVKPRHRARSARLPFLNRTSRLSPAQKESAMSHRQALIRRDANGATTRHRKDDAHPSAKPTALGSPARRAAPVRYHEVRDYPATGCARTIFK